MLLRFWDTKSGSPQGQYIDPKGTVSVYLWMEMGKDSHGSSPVKIERKNTGVFKVKQIYFPMIWNWEVHVQLQQGSQVLEKVLCIQAVTQ